MSLVAITCSSCGGSVAMEAGKSRPACLFCGAQTLVEEPEEQVEPPATWLPFQVDVDTARQYFREWSKKRFWAPTEIRQARLELNQLLLPAWVWSGRVETHWAALVRGATRSGKRPLSGVDTLDENGLLVPASPTLKRAELADISPFQIREELTFDPQKADLPFELGMLTRRAARTSGMAAMRAAHAEQIDGAVGASRLSTSCLFSDLDGRPLLLPIWIGAYRVADKPYRVVLNGQSGALTGKAPVSFVKVMIALALVAAMICGGLLVAGVGALIAGS